jgi:hypothetical protein
MTESQSEVGLEHDETYRGARRGTQTRYDYFEPNGNVNNISNDNRPIFRNGHWVM